MISAELVAQELRTQARRYLLVGTSMFLGVLGVVVVALANSVATDMLIAKEEQMNGREASYRAELRAAGDGPFATGETSAEALFHELESKAGPGLAGLTLAVEVATTVYSVQAAADSSRGTSVSGWWGLGDLTTVRRLPVLDGRPASPGCYPGEVMLNQAAAEELQVDVGDEVVVAPDSIHGPRTVVLTAVVSDARSQPQLYGSWELIRCAQPDVARLESATVDFVTHAGAAVTLQKITADVVARAGLEVNGTVRRVDTVEGVRGQIETLSSIFAVCALLLLLVSALGIASVGIASVDERARELVVRRAFGATRSAVFAQVISGATIVGGIVAIAAFVCAIAGTYWLLPVLIPLETSIVAPEFPLVAGLTGCAAALGTSIAGGIVPAVKATRIPVAQALRD